MFNSDEIARCPLHLLSLSSIVKHKFRYSFAKYLISFQNPMSSKVLITSNKELSKAEKDFFLVSWNFLVVIITMSNEQPLISIAQLARTIKYTSCIRQWSGRPGFNPRLSHTKGPKMVLDAALQYT